MKGHGRVARGERKVGQLSKLCKLCEKVGKLCHMKWSTSSLPSGSVASGLCHQVRSVSRRAVRVPCRKCVCARARAFVRTRGCASLCSRVHRAGEAEAHDLGGKGRGCTRVRRQGTSVDQSGGCGESAACGECGAWNKRGAQCRERERHGGDLRTTNEHQPH